MLKRCNYYVYFCFVLYIKIVKNEKKDLGIKFVYIPTSEKFTEPIDI